MYQKSLRCGLVTMAMTGVGIAYYKVPWFLPDITPKKAISTLVSTTNTTRSNESHREREDAVITPSAIGLARDSLLPTGPKTHPLPQLSKSSLDRFIVIPEYKLLFCYVDKVGCSMFNDLFRVLRMVHLVLAKNNATNTDELKYQAKQLWFRNTPKHHSLSSSDLERIMINPNWTKAVFFRDPASRFLSAYRSKCGRKDRNGARQCKTVFGSKITSQKGSADAFHEFFHNYQQNNTNNQVHQRFKMSNPHFNPMSKFCGGLNNTLEYYDFVHQLKPSTSVQHIRKLLVDIVGVPQSQWDDYGLEELIQTGGHSFATLLQQQLGGAGMHVQQGSIPSDHNTGTGTKETLEHFFDPSKSDAIKILHELYFEDYELFRLAKLNIKELQEWLQKR